MFFTLSRLDRLRNLAIFDATCFGCVLGLLEDFLRISEMASRGPSALSYGERMGDRSPVGSYRQLDERWRVG